MGLDVQREGLIQIQDNVFAQVGPEGESNQGIVVTKEGSILVDNYIKHYESLRQSLDRVSRNLIKIVVNTHSDYDHFSANHFFRRQGAWILASERSRSQIALMMTQEAPFQEIKNRNPALAHEATQPMELIPHLGIHSKASLALGGVLLELISVGHGHSPGDLVVYLPEKGIVFTGDLVFIGTHGRLKTANIKGLLDILDTLAALSFDHLIPGHGLPANGSAAHEAVSIYRDYVLTIQEKISHMVKAGLGLEEITAAFKNWKYMDWERPQHFAFAIHHVYTDILLHSRFK